MRGNNRKTWLKIILSIIFASDFSLSNPPHASTDDVGVRQRTILWYLVFVGFSVNYMIRINVNIAIVDMLSSSYNSKKSTENLNISSSECFVRNASEFQTANSTLLQLQRETSQKFPSLERKILDKLGVSWHNREREQISTFINFYLLSHVKHSCHTVDMLPWHQLRAINLDMHELTPICLSSRHK